MKTSSKSIIVLIAIIVIASVVVLYLPVGGELFKGQIINEPSQTLSESGELPDLVPELEVIIPEEADGDLSVKATIMNKGKGAVSGSMSFKYAIYINDTEVFSNTDSYSEVGPGDSFNFTYPISRLIYEYPDEGTVKLALDTDDKVKESDEKNNEVEEGYAL